MAAYIPAYTPCTGTPQLDVPRVLVHLCCIYLVCRFPQLHFPQLQIYPSCIYPVCRQTPAACYLVCWFTPTVSHKTRVLSYPGWLCFTYPICHPPRACHFEDASMPGNDDPDAEPFVQSIHLLFPWATDVLGILAPNLFLDATFNITTYSFKVVAITTLDGNRQHRPLQVSLSSGRRTT